MNNLPGMWIFLESDQYEKTMTQAKLLGSKPDVEYQTYLSAYQLANSTNRSVADKADAAMGMCNAAHLMKDDVKFADALAKFKAIQLDPSDQYHKDALALLSSSNPTDVDNAGKVGQYIFVNGKYTGLKIPLGGSVQANVWNNPNATTDQVVQSNTNYEQLSDELVNSTTNANILAELDKADAQQHDVGMWQSVKAFVKATWMVGFQGAKPVNTALYMVREISLEEILTLICIVQLVVSVVVEVASFGAATPVTAVTGAGAVAGIAGSAVARTAITRMTIGALAKYGFRLFERLTLRFTGKLTAKAATSTPGIMSLLKTEFNLALDGIKIAKGAGGETILVKAGQAAGSVARIPFFEQLVGSGGKYSKMLFAGLGIYGTASGLTSNDQQDKSDAHKEIGMFAGMTLNQLLSSPKFAGQAYRTHVFKMFFMLSGFAIIFDKLQGLKFYLCYIIAIGIEYIGACIKMGIAATPIGLMYKVVTNGFDISAIAKSYETDVDNLIAPFKHIWQDEGTLLEPMEEILHEFKDFGQSISSATTKAVVNQATK